MEERAKKFKKAIKSKNLNGFIVTSPVNIFYLCGFKGISLAEREALLIYNPRATLITARLYQNEALKLESKNLKVIIADERNEINRFILESFRGSTIKIGFEEHDIKYSELRQFRKILKGKKLIPTKHLIENLRIIKTSEEIKNIKKAQVISQKALYQIIRLIKARQTEAEIADVLVKIIKNLGGQGLAFEPIVASGPNSALPHYATGQRKIKKGDVLLFDFGAKYKNYCADLSRTVFIGKAKNEHRNIYDHVFNAQQKIIEKIEHGIKASKAHQTVDSHFKEKNIHQNFLHSLGHGIGLEVHEKPSLSRNSKDKLTEGMVFSVEPGLYFPEWGGVRIEDLVVIQDSKAKILGKKSEFIEIG